jgi:hypothetical protein
MAKAEQLLGIAKQTNRTSAKAVAAARTLNKTEASAFERHD